MRHLRQEPLAAATHHRLQEPDELARRLALERALQDLALGRLGDAGGLEDGPDPLIRLDRAGHTIQQLAERVAHGEQGFRVVAGDGDALHRDCSALARPSRNSVTSRRLASVSRFASITRDAAAMDSSTASRRSARIAFSFSASLSLRARVSTASYSSRALASNVSPPSATPISPWREYPGPRDAPR